MRCSRLVGRVVEVQRRKLPHQAWMSFVMRLVRVVRGHDLQVRSVDRAIVDNFQRTAQHS